MPKLFHHVMNNLVVLQTEKLLELAITAKVRIKVRLRPDAKRAAYVSRDLYASLECLKLDLTQKIHVIFQEKYVSASFRGLRCAWYQCRSQSTPGLSTTLSRLPRVMVVGRLAATVENMLVS